MKICSRQEKRRVQLEVVKALWLQRTLERLRIEFEISVESLATKTEMSSSSRSSKKLGGGLDPLVSLRNLPLIPR